MDNIQTIKQRFGIIGIDDSLNRALEKALRVASTNISVEIMLSHPFILVSVSK